MNNINKIINGSNVIALGFIIFGSIVIVENIPFNQLGKYTGYVSPFIGLIMFMIKYIQERIKDGKSRIESLERLSISLEQSIKLLNAHIGDLNINIIKNSTNIARNDAKLEVIAKYGQLEERIKETEKRIQSIELFSFDEFK